MQTPTSLALFLAVSLSACASGQVLPVGSDDPNDAETSGSGDPDEGGSDPTAADGAWDPAALGGGDCSAITGFVHVVSTGGNLYTFWPPTRAFHKVGRLDCGSTDSPLSMAIDREGMAHVLYWDSTVYDVDLQTGACAASGFQGSVGQYSYFGMAYATDRLAPNGESLFVREAVFYDGQDPLVRRLGHLDLEASAVNTIGSGDGANADLTGTGDGRLFAFVKNLDATGSVSELDPKTGATLTVDVLANVTVGDSWAFASWGGDLWLFSSQTGEGTNVFRYAPGSGSAALVATEENIRVIGAGVSTCVPVKGPS